MTEPTPQSEPLERYRRLVEAFEDLRHRDPKATRRTDLLSIADCARTEVIHSAIVAWLLEPTASHGLGSAVVGAILAAGWDEPAEGADTAAVDREAGRFKTRVDIKVDLGSKTLIIENKVDAPEQPTQCEDFYREWGTSGRYLLLSPTGRLPHSVQSPAARAAWRSLSYGSLARLLEDLAPAANGPGRVAYLAYIEALGQLFPRQRTFEVHREETPVESPDPFDAPRLRFFLQNRQEIGELRDIETEFKLAFNHEVQSLLGPMLAALKELDPSVEGSVDKWGGAGPKHPMFWRPSWRAVDGQARASIGLAWDGADPTHECLYAGLFARDKAWRKWLDDDFATAPTAEWRKGIYPVAYQYLSAPADWWMHLHEWRAGLTHGVVLAWKRYADRVDAGLSDLGEA